MEHYEIIDVYDVKIGELVEIYLNGGDGPINGKIVSLDRDFFVIQHVPLTKNDFTVPIMNRRRTYMKNTVRVIYAIERPDFDLGI